MAFAFPHGRILVFAKAPEPGRVKTRLIHRYGARGAAQIYRALLNETLQRLQAAQLCPTELWCAPDTRHGYFIACRSMYGLGCSLHRQRDGDLGRRMNHALSDALRRSRYALLIGGDCPGLRPELLSIALESLADGRDALLGPAEDGGYWLIGLRSPCARLFSGIAWGTPAVLAATRRRLRRAAMSWRELAVGWDVDRPSDVRRWKRERGTS